MILAAFVFTATPFPQLPTGILFKASIMFFLLYLPSLNFLAYSNLVVLGKCYPSHNLKPQKLLPQMQTSGPPLYLKFNQLDGMPAHMH